ncbi:MAG: acetyl-CoA carboxylase, carboxyltransferase subunit beta [Alphaproteobacteria bacterium]|nr:acetyl-CoA carboxylase, carboxyltransferase subunit beta [Alphaproteobacteria bacterium]
MNWISRNLPKINWFENDPKTQSKSADLWQQCPACSSGLFLKQLQNNAFVCPQCDHHLRMPVAERLTLLFGDDPSTEITLPTVPDDPLHFRDSKRYADRLKDARAKTRHRDAFRAFQGVIGSYPVVVGVMDFAFMGGSMGVAVGSGILHAAKTARETQSAFIILTASGGARMQEGILSLMQLPRTVLATNMIRDAGLPYIVVLTDPTTGGVSASFAMLGDIQLAEPGSLIGFAGQRVIEQTVREQLPEGFQRAEYLRDHGFVDRVVHRHQMVPELGLLLSYLMPASS